jgi:hypothetical protein
MAPKKNAPKRSMTPEHKAALATGREQGRAVKAYLEGLSANKPKRGRRRSTESMQARLAEIEDALATADPFKQLQLTQEHIDLTEKLSADDTTVDITELESEFIRVAKAYAANKKISYAAFRAVGVPADVLRKAGISRSA